MQFTVPLGKNMNDLKSFKSQHPSGDGPISHRVSRPVGGHLGRDQDPEVMWILEP